MGFPRLSCRGGTSGRVTYFNLRDAWLNHVDSCADCNQNQFGSNQLGQSIRLRFWTVAKICAEGRKLLDSIGDLI